MNKFEERANQNQCVLCKKPLQILNLKIGLLAELIKEVKYNGMNVFICKKHPSPKE